MSNFFPIKRGDLGFIVILLLFAFVSLLPRSRDSAWAGMDMLGWMMAILMVLSPVIALIQKAEIMSPTRFPTDSR